MAPEGTKSARNALSNMLYQIRSTLGKEIIESRGNEEISINPDTIWCDAIAFEEALDLGNPRKALELYRDNLLLGFHVSDVSNEFQDWLDAERERLKRRAAEGAWKLAEEAAETKNLSAARNWAKKAANFTPFDDDAQARLITLLNRLGYRADALETYEEFTGRLRSEWEMEPTDKLKSLVRDIQVQSEEKSKESSEPEELRGLDSQKSDQISKITDSKSRQTTKENRSNLQWSISAAAGFILMIVAGWIIWPDAPLQNSTAPGLSRQSVAVLPFTYLSAEDSTDYFSLGMTEEILTRLAQIDDLSVTSRTSVMQYTDTKKNLQEIAEELGVGAIVEGSVQRVGEQLRITAQLINAETDRHLWSQSYDRQLGDVFEIQSEIAVAIANELRAKLAPDVEERIERVPTKDLVSYELFLRARDYSNRVSTEGNEIAIKLLQQALERDSTFALARALLAKTYAREAWNFGAVSERATLAISEAERAVATEPDLAAAHSALGFARMSAGQFTDAIESFERAIELNPNEWAAINSKAIVYLQTGRITLAIQSWEKALKADPAGASGYRFNLALAYRILGLLHRAEQENLAVLSLDPNQVNATVNQGHVDLFQGDTTAVVNAAEKLIDQNPSNSYALMAAGWLLIFVDQPERARESLERSYKLSPSASGEGYTRVRLAYTLWLAGEQDRAIELFHEFENFANEQIERGNEYGMLPYSLAVTHAVQGESDEALYWLEQAVDRGWPYELTTIHDPLFKSVRNHQRFQDLVGRMHDRNEGMRREIAQTEISIN